MDVPVPLEFPKCPRREVVPGSQFLGSVGLLPAGLQDFRTTQELLVPEDIGASPGESRELVHAVFPDGSGSVGTDLVEKVEGEADDPLRALARAYLLGREMLPEMLLQERRQE